MSRIFLSHSSKDNFKAVALGDWLLENGWDDVFLDLDPAQGIHPGERWERKLYEQAAECAAVLFLVSSDWLASDWCRREYELARKLNKRIFVVLIDKTPIIDLPQFLKDTHQAVSLALGEDHLVFHPKMPVTHEEGHVTFSAEGLARLKAGLTQAGLDPRFFAWPPEDEPARTPYRGLEPLEAKDAGVFFGRDAPVVEALDALRGLREAASPRLFVILGASGAGKSSFLRAGLLPRLARDDNFLSLPAIRPERAAITGANGLVAALVGAAAKAGLATTRAQICEAAASGAEALRPILRTLAQGDANLTFVVAIDQAEELFRAEGAAEGELLLTLLHDLTASDDPAVIALFAIRSDLLDALEHAKSFEGRRPKTFALLPMPRGAYQTVIERPAQRLAKTGRKFEIDPGLTQALLEDLEKGGGSDALPLLSFTLEQLYRDHEAAGRISREDYQNFGGLKGAIDAGLARALVEADKDARIPRDADARLLLLRRGLIPWLAGVDPETRTPRRRIARTAQIPSEARPLIDLLVEQRLLTRDVDAETGEATIEPAHELLLRQWGGLKSWLDEDFGQLAALEGVQRAARDWDANARAPAWAAHGGARLEEADRLDARPDLTALLGATDRAYLAACRDKDKAAREAEAALLRAEASSARNARRVAVASSVGLAVALGLAVLAGWQWQLANTQREHAEKTLALATKTANGLVFDLAQKFRDTSGVPASLVDDILGRARMLQDQLTGGGADSKSLRSSQYAALVETATTRLAMGDTKGAIEAARKAVAITEALSASDPRNAEWRRELSVSYNKVGDGQTAQGDLAAALKSYRDGLAIIEPLSASDPGKGMWRQILSLSYNRIGDVQKAQGDLPAALKSYRDSLAVREVLSASDPGNTGWRQDLSLSHEKIGDVQVAQGDLAAALKSHRDSLAIREALSASDPGNASWRRDISVSYEKVGDVQMAQGDLAAAAKSFRDSLAIREALSASDPGNAGWRMDLSTGYERLGIVRKAQGDLAAAAKSYLDSLAIREALSASDPGNAGWRQGLSTSYDWVGNVQFAQGDLAAAAKSYLDSLVIREALLASDPGNAEWRRALSVSYEKVGDVRMAQGDLAAALKSFRDSLAIIEALSASDPGNIGWRRHLSISYNKVGDVQKAQGDLAAALKSYRDSLAVFEVLSASDAGWRQDLSTSYERLGTVQSAQGDLAGALKSFRDSLTIRKALSASDPGNSEWRRDLSLSYENFGTVQAEQGDLEAALISYRDGLAIIEALSATDPGNTVWRRDLGRSNERIGATLVKQSDGKGAVAAFERALSTYDALLHARPDDVQSKLLSVIPHWHLARLDSPHARTHLEAALAILEPLAAADRLDPMRRGWIAKIKAQLAALDHSSPAKPEK